MTSISNSARWVGWWCAGVLCSLLWLVAPLRAEDPLPDAQSPVGDDASSKSGNVHAVGTNLRNASIEAVRVLGEVAEDDALDIFALETGDLNGDGITDAVAHVARPESADASDPASALLVAVGNRNGSARVTTRIENGMLCPYCPIGSFDAVRSLPEQSLTVSDGQVRICERWGAAWYARECSVARLSGNELVLVSHSEVGGWSRGPAEHRVDLDFAARRGERGYVAHPTERGFPVLDHSASFALMAARKIAVEDAPETPDGITDDTVWNAVEARHFDADSGWVTRGGERLVDASDLAFTVRAAWTESGLWLVVDVTDDRVITGACPEGTDPLQTDLVEVWLDRAHGDRAQGNDEEVETHRRVYLEDPQRHVPDESLSAYRVAVGERETCSVLALPAEGRSGGPLPESAATLRESEQTPHAPGSGYSVEMYIPGEQFGVEALSEWSGRDSGIGLTVVVHDVDDADAPHERTELATSDLRWGDPYTLGIMILPTRELVLPRFPFDWGAWVD